MSIFHRIYCICQGKRRAKLIFDTNIYSSSQGFKTDSFHFRLFPCGLLQLTHPPTSSAAYMHLWIRSALVQIMTCRLIGAKPLSEPMLGYCQLDRRNKLLIIFQFKYKLFIDENLPKWWPFSLGKGELKHILILPMCFWVTLLVPTKIKQPWRICLNNSHHELRYKQNKSKCTIHSQKLCAWIVLCPVAGPSANTNMADKLDMPPLKFLLISISIYQYFHITCWDHMTSFKMVGEIWQSLTAILNTLRPRQNGHHFPDDILKCNENVWISHKISLNFVSKVQINNIPALIHIMAWPRPGDKPLSEPMMA